MDKPKHIIVAGCDAPKRVKHCASYRCDGIEDDVELEFAINTAKHRGLPIRFVGTFWLSQQKEVQGQEVNRIDV